MNLTWFGFLSLHLLIFFFFSLEFEKKNETQTKQTCSHSYTSEDSRGMAYSNSGLSSFLRQCGGVKTVDAN